MLKNMISVAFGAVFWASAALAQTGNFSPDAVAQVDILPGWRTTDGTHMAALRVRLAPGWKTYWRAPGDAGIPPRFEWTGSQNIASVRFHWPTPNIFHDYGLRTIGYKDELILPMEFLPNRSDAAIAVRATVQLGVCEDICVPISVQVRADLGKGASDPVIVRALKNRPMPARRAGLQEVACRVSPISDGLRVQARLVMPPLARDEIVVLEYDDQRIWMSEATVARQGNVLMARADLVPPRRGAFALDRSRIRLTVLGGGQAVNAATCAGLNDRSQ